MARWGGIDSWGKPAPESVERRREALPGTSPFIVPPAAAKSAFYNNPVTRELWQSAARALRAADDVVLVGYSIPVTDLVTTGMLADTISKDTAVTVVNPCPESVVERLIDLGVAREQISTIEGKDCVQSFVEAAERSLEPEMDFGDDNACPLAVGQAGREYRVTGFTGLLRPGTARLQVDPGWSPSLDTSTQSVSLADIRNRGPLQRIEVDFGAGLVSTVASITRSPGPSGATECLLLTPTAVPLPGADTTRH
jgi:hypothetical protein